MPRRKWINSISPLPLIAAALLAGCGGDDANESPDPGSSAPPRVSEERIGGTPVAVAVGEGAVWVADQTGGSVVRIDTADTTERSTAQVGDGPLAVAAGEGAAWVANAEGTVRRLDPSTGEPSGPPIRVADPTGIAAGEEGVWVANGTEGTVTRIDPASGEVTGEPIDVGPRPVDVAVGEGSVWVANTEDGTVSRIDAESGTVEATIDVAEEQVLALAYGDGAVWAAKSDDRLGGTVEVVRIDPANSTVSGDAVPIDAANPVRLAAGEGYVWATLVGGAGPLDNPQSPAVQRIDPSTFETLGEPVEVGERPLGIAVGEGSAWVADSGDGTVSRLTPAQPAS